jgi:Tfp pilus assembly protein PilW
MSELMIGVVLSTIVMGAVINSYVFVARSYTRTVGFGLPNQPTLEGQGRRTLAYFSQDAQVASAIYVSTVAPLAALSASEVTFSVPLPTGGTRYVTYFYNSTAAAVSKYSVTVPAQTLVRIDRSTNTFLTLHSSLLTCVFTYYDVVGQPYSNYTDYLLGLKQVSFILTAQAGTSANNTLTGVYRVTSPRLVLRNKSLLP